MIFHKFANGTGCKDHDCGCHHHGDDHDHNFIGHTHCGDDRIEGKHDIQQHDLDDHTGEIRSHLCGSLAFMTLQFFMNFSSALIKKEKTTSDQDQIVA